MIALIQRVKQAKVEVANVTVGAIEQGILVFLGIEKQDDSLKAKKLCQKILNYRIFPDQQGKMNLNVQQVGGKLLIVSQFTLVADTQSGTRPSFSSAASPELGQSLYNEFINMCHKGGVSCECGEFGADMQVSLINDGPVTFQLKV